MAELAALGDLKDE